MMLAGILGLYGHALAAPAGVVAVGDHDAASLFGGAATSCSRYYATTGCGGNAKPKMGMIPGTKCPKVPGVYWLPIFGNLRYKQSVVVTCYECCYACGSVRRPLDACAPTGSGSGRPTPETGGLP
jgi:hypothetical protein